MVILEDEFLMIVDTRYLIADQLINLKLKFATLKKSIVALIKSISGIRGTIGGKPGENLTPLDIVKFTAAFAGTLDINDNKKIVIGRDGRISGKMISDL